MATRKELFAATLPITITLNSLASSTTGVGRQSTLIDNTVNLYLSANIYVQITVGTTPVANSLAYVYLLRSDNGSPALVDDNAGSSDAAITIVNAKLLGTIAIPLSTTNAAYTESFDTSFLGPLGPKWGIAVVNSTGVAFYGAGNSVTYIGVNETIA